MFTSTRTGTLPAAPHPAPAVTPQRNECLRSPRLCVIGVAETHPLLDPSRTVVRVDFNVDSKDTQDRNKLHVTGKKKRVQSRPPSPATWQHLLAACVQGAVGLKANAGLCRAQCSDGTEFMFRACVDGDLIEINRRLLSDPEVRASFRPCCGFFWAL